MWGSTYPPPSYQTGLMFSRLVVWFYFIHMPRNLGLQFLKYSNWPKMKWIAQGLIARHMLQFPCVPNSSKSTLSAKSCDASAAADASAVLLSVFSSEADKTDTNKTHKTITEIPREKIEDASDSGSDRLKFQEWKRNRKFEMEAWNYGDKMIQLVVEGNFEKNGYSAFITR